MMSRSRMRPSSSASRQARMASKVSGLSQIPPIIASRPASIRLAMAISPSRDSSSTDPISRRYMRTGSSVRPISSSSILPPFTTSSSSSPAGLRSSRSSLSSSSMTFTPISESWVMMSSICSDDIWSDGSAAFSSS